MAASYGTISHPEIDENSNFRTIKVNLSGNNESLAREQSKIKFGSNSVSTAKYTALSFLPM
jgi:hypothetical protein